MEVKQIELEEKKEDFILISYRDETYEVKYMKIPAPYSEVVMSLGKSLLKKSFLIKK